jgi:hypothetical protein
LNGSFGVCNPNDCGGFESNEGKGGDTKRQEKPEGAILEDSRMWVEGERWMESQRLWC